MGTSLTPAPIEGSSASEDDTVAVPLQERSGHSRHCRNTTVDVAHVLTGCVTEVEHDDDGRLRDDDTDADVDALAAPLMQALTDGGSIMFGGCDTLADSVCTLG